MNIHLDPNQVPPQLKGGYRGRKFKAVVTATVDIPMDAGLWSGGSRDHYTMVRLSDGATVPFPGQHLAPFAERKAHVVTLEPGYAIVRSSMFCGTDMGLTFYVHTDNAAALLPAPAGELTPHQLTVLDATCSFKSSYNGKDRYEMARDNVRWKTDAPPFMTREQWDTAKTELIAAGYLNRAGAVTVKGRNARPSRY